MPTDAQLSNAAKGKAQSAGGLNVGDIILYLTQVGYTNLQGMSRATLNKTLTDHLAGKRPTQPRQRTEDQQKRDQQKRERERDQQKRDQQKRDQQKRDQQKRDQQKRDQQKRDQQKRDQQKRDQQKRDQQKREQQKPGPDEPGYIMGCIDPAATFQIFGQSPAPLIFIPYGDGTTKITLTYAGSTHTIETMPGPDRLYIGGMLSSDRVPFGCVTCAVADTTVYVVPSSMSSADIDLLQPMFSNLIAILEPVYLRRLEARYGELWPDLLKMLWYLSDKYAIRPTGAPVMLQHMLRTDRPDSLYKVLETQRPNTLMRTSRLRNRDRPGMYTTCSYFTFLPLDLFEDCRSYLDTPDPLMIVSGDILPSLRQSAATAKADIHFSNSWNFGFIDKGNSIVFGKPPARNMLSEWYAQCKDHIFRSMIIRLGAKQESEDVMSAFVKTWQGSHEFCVCNIPSFPLHPFVIRAPSGKYVFHNEMSKLGTIMDITA